MLYVSFPEVFLLSHIFFEIKCFILWSDIKIKKINFLFNKIKCINDYKIQTMWVPGHAFLLNNDLDGTEYGLSIKYYCLYYITAARDF